MMLDCEVVQTRDGTPAMRDRATGELMHRTGPLLEARRLYSEPARLSQRLSEASREPLVVLDAGLGAGSNALAAWRCSEALDGARRPLRILSLDRSAAALELALQPRHAAGFGLSGAAGDAARCLLQHGRHSSSHCDWQLQLGDLQELLAQLPDALVDVVFWDPFSPRVNPELWTHAAFAAVRRACRPGATLHTYSGATSVRAALLLAGFAVGVGEKISEGKYATCAATHRELLEQPLDRRWVERLSRSTAPLPPDAPPDALAMIRALPQFSA
jgi:queuine tRNA-ribosyltransferase